MKILPMVNDLLHADGRADVTKLIVALRSFVKATEEETARG